MSTYLLDTNIISVLVRNSSGAAAQRIEHLDPGDLCTSIIVAADLRYGCAKKGSAKLLARVEAVLAFVPILPLDISADGEYSGISARLEAAGQIIGMNDLLIAAHAYTHKVTLVTNNIREFSPIRGLKLENWLDDLV